MMRFIFACMVMVALSILAVAGQFMMDGIQTAKNDITNRDMAVAVQEQTPAGQTLTFDDIYAMAPKPADTTGSANPDDLNAIVPAAGDDSFNGGFSSQAPKALADDALETMAAPEGTEPSAN